MTLDICLFSPPEIWSLNKSVLPLEQNYIIICITYCIRPSMAAQTVKSLPAMQETCVRSLGWEDPLEEGMATHSSVLAWRIPMDRGAWWATVHGVPESQTRLNDQQFLLHLLLFIVVDHLIVLKTSKTFEMLHILHIPWYEVCLLPQRPNHAA